MYIIRERRDKLNGYRNNMLSKLYAIRGENIRKNDILRAALV